MLNSYAYVLITTEADYWCTDTLWDKRLFSPGLWKMTSLSSTLEQIRICYGTSIRREKSIYENGNTLCYCYRLSSQRYMVMANFVPEKWIICSMLLPFSLIVFCNKGKHLDMIPSQHSLSLIFCCSTPFLSVQSDWKVGVKHYHSDLLTLTPSLYSLHSRSDD